MHVPGILVTMCNYVDKFSGIKFYCDSSITKEAMAFFENVFKEEYNNEINLVIEECEICHEKKIGFNPIKRIESTEYGFFVSLGYLCLYCFDEEYEFYTDLNEMLKRVLDKVKEKYSQIEYDCYIAYDYSDCHGGEDIQYELTSKPFDGEVVDRYDYIGLAFAEALEKEPKYFWENFEDYFDPEEDWYQEIIDFFETFEKFISPADMERFISLKV